MKIKLLAALLLCYAATAQAASGERQCRALAKAKPYNTEITDARWVKAGALERDGNAAMTGASGGGVEYPAHCLVQGAIERRIGVNGKNYATNFQLRLPENWNTKFLFQGGGGMNGFIAPAVGSIPVRGATAAPALKRGYAVVSTDGGHQGRSDGSFGADQQARLDLAYASIGKVTVTAKQLVEQFYRRKPDLSYFMGCSNGGREAMLAAMRYPLEFDGAVAGNPGFRLSRAAVAQAWDNRHFMAAAPVDAAGNKIFANALTQQDLDAVSQGVLNRCDASDGLKDGIVNAWEKCDFKPEMVQRQIGRKKVALLNAVFGGAKNSRGENVYSSWPYDTGINTADWRAWKLGSSQTAKPDARNITLGAVSLPQYFMTPYQPDFDTMTFNFDTDVAKTDQIGALNNADATNLTTFQARGGKMVVFEGVSDPVFSAHDLRDWYKQLLQDTWNARNTVRLFNVPGMTHCGGGSALDDFDPLTALENWREKGRTPEFMVAQGKAFPGKTQPVCAYPAVATYKGGDVNSAASFECR